MPCDRSNDDGNIFEWAFTLYIPVVGIMTASVEDLNKVLASISPAFERRYVDLYEKQLGTSSDSGWVGVGISTLEQLVRENPAMEISPGERPDDYCIVVTLRPGSKKPEGVFDRCYQGMRVVCRY